MTRADRLRWLYNANCASMGMSIGGVVGNTVAHRLEFAAIWALVGAGATVCVIKLKRWR